MAKKDKTKPAVKKPAVKKPAEKNISAEAIKKMIAEGIEKGVEKFKKSISKDVSAIGETEEQIARTNAHHDSLEKAWKEQCRKSGHKFDYRRN